MPIGKKIVEIPESEVSEIFVKQFIIAFDKVNRHERFGPTSIECIREIDIITKKNDGMHIILVTLKKNDYPIIVSQQQLSIPTPIQSIM